MTIIETKKLRLRPLVDNDAAFIAREIGNFNVSRNLARVPHPYSLDDAIDFLDWIKSYDDWSLVCGVELKSAPNQLIGIISYEHDNAEDTIELGYWYAEKHWGNGYGREAAAAMVHDAFMVKKIERLIASFHNDNPASANILLGLGFIEISQGPYYSKAQSTDVPSTRLHLTRNQWLAKQQAIS